MPAGEFPANLYPWIRAEQAGIIDEVRSVTGSRRPAHSPMSCGPSWIETPRAVALSSVDYSTGFRADLEAMRELAGDALLVVDAIQRWGHSRHPWSPADVVVAGGQKWLRAGMGVAVMAVSGRAMERLEPTLSGWLGVAEPFDFDLPVPQPVHASALRYQMSAPPFPAAAGITAALEVLELAGIDAISEAILARSAAVEEAGRRAGAEVLAPWRSDSERSGVVSLRMPERTARGNSGPVGLGRIHRIHSERLAPAVTARHHSTGHDRVSGTGPRWLKVDTIRVSLLTRINWDVRPLFDHRPKTRLEAWGGHGVDRVSRADAIFLGAGGLPRPWHMAAVLRISGLPRNGPRSPPGRARGAVPCGSAAPTASAMAALWLWPALLGG